MKIKLNEIPEDGRDYSFNRETAELNSVLEDLIRQNDYNIELDIRPLNTRDFTVNGKVKTQTYEQCSRCAQDFNFSIDKAIREILIPTQEQGRTGKYAKSSSHTVSDAEEGVSVTEYSKQQFDLGEFLHEAIALEVPFNPFCDVCLLPENSEAFIYDEKMGEEQKPSPFSALKGIKID